MNHPPQRQTLVLLISGVPATGKSTLARTLCRHWNEHRAEEFAILYLEYDSIQEDLQQNNDSLDSIQAWRKARTVALERLGEALRSKNIDRRQIVVLDDTFHLRSMRKRVFQTGQRVVRDLSFADKSRGPDSFALYGATLWLSAPELDTCLTRNNQRNRETLDRTIPAVSDITLRKIFSSREAPLSKFQHERETDDKEVASASWFDPTHKIVNTDEYSGGLKQCVAEIDEWVINSIFKNHHGRLSLEDSENQSEAELEQRSRDRQQTAKNRAHQLDQWTRKFWVPWVARLDSSLAGSANKIRKQLLADQQDMWTNEELDSENCSDSFAVILRQEMTKEFVHRLSEITSWDAKQQSAFFKEILDQDKS